MNVRGIEKAFLGCGLVASLVLSPKESEAQKREKQVTPVSLLKEYYINKSLEKIDTLDMSSDEYLRIKEEHQKYSEIGKHPENYYQQLWSQINTVKKELKEHFESVGFFSKLLDNNEFSSDMAKAFQTKFTYNLESLTINLADPDTVKRYAKRTSGSACYLPQSHQVLISYLGATPDEIRYYIINGLYTDNVSGVDACVLFRSFKRDNNSSEALNDYLLDPLNRMVYKKNLDIEMQKFGIRYNNKFGDTEYEILLKERMSGKLSPESTDLIDTCNEKQLIEIMNTLATVITKNRPKLDGSFFSLNLFIWWLTHFLSTSVCTFHRR